MASQPGIMLVGSYPPRNCGIATFTFDLYQSLLDHTGYAALDVMAVDNVQDGYSYPSEVVFQIYQNDPEEYKRAADLINSSDVETVCFQHEFGIYGGEAGSYFSKIIRRIRKPIITTLHTVIRNPSPEYLRSTQEIIRYSDHLVVLSETGRAILKEVYSARDDQIHFIHHGVPDVPFLESDRFKDQFKFGRRPVILTFGLINPNKGIEVMLESLPPVVKEHPDLLYVVLGATHPEIKKYYGESYRAYLEQKARELNLEKNIVFHNRFVTNKELMQFILAADIYVTPYMAKEQIVSGTLAYAVGMGKAVISTPYWYAQEMLSGGRGILVDFGNADELSSAVLNLIANPQGRNQMRRKAYDFGRTMTWNQVARQYLDLFNSEKKVKKTVGFVQHETCPVVPLGTVPDINLKYLRLLSDDVGVIQHTCFGIPERHHGYSTDDVGRALVAALKVNFREPEESLACLINTYMSFLRYAQNKKGSFYNFLRYDRKFIKRGTSEDTLGRAIWGLGCAAELGPAKGIRTVALMMLEKAKAQILSLTAPRAKAYVICGLHPVARSAADHKSWIDIIILLADDLAEMFCKNQSSEWAWFEDAVTYGNAKICEALLRAYELTNKKIYREVALESLDFLTRIQWNGRFFDLVGNDGWYPRDGKKATFGQQPIDAGYLAEAYAKAHSLTGKNHYLYKAGNALKWFMGRNRLGQSLYNDETGAVSDGLDHNGVSQNHGAESTICYLLGLYALKKAMQPRSEIEKNTGVNKNGPADILHNRLA